MNNIVCSYGCVATTDSQGVGTIRDLPNDELGKILQLLQKQSEDKKEKTMKCDNCDNPATMHKHYEKSDGTFADSHLCGKCFRDKYIYNSCIHDTCAWCGKKLNNNDGFYLDNQIFYLDNQMRKYCSYDCVRRFMGYEYGND